MCWRLRTIVQRHGARRPSRPQLKREPLGGRLDNDQTGRGMTSSFWPALIGFALGSSQVLLIDWIRARSQHRRQLRLLRSELRRLSGFHRHWGLQHNIVPPDDITPNPPRITASYQRLLQEIDFWVTDEHSDDNTQQGLIDIADGAALLERYDANVRKLLDDAKTGRTHAEKAKYLKRAVETAQAYDKELDRWQVIVTSALSDVDRRLRCARMLNQVGRAFRPMPDGENPPPLAPISR